MAIKPGMKGRDVGMVGRQWTALGTNLIVKPLAILPTNVYLEQPSQALNWMLSQVIFSRAISSYRAAFC